MLSIDDVNFSNALKEFCHHFQIPFIENHLIKTTYNAAKIYYRLEENGVKMPVSSLSFF